MLPSILVLYKYSALKVVTVSVHDFFYRAGFGFVSFESEEPAEKVCSIQYHDIKGKKVS